MTTPAETFPFVNFSYFTIMVSPLPIQHSAPFAARCRRPLLWLVGAIGSLLLGPLKAHPQPIQRLIVAEFRKDASGTGNYTYIVAYCFQAGRLLGKDTVLGSPMDSTAYPNSSFRFDLGRSFIYHNRYAISGTGNVVDLQAKRVLGNGDVFVSADRNTMLFHRDNIFTGTGYLQLNLTTGAYGFINHLKRDRDEDSSPDGRWRLSIDCSVLPYKIMLKDGKEQVLVANAGSGPNLSGDSQFPTVLTYWLNNQQFLYTVHRHRSFVKRTGYGDVALHRFDLQTRQDTIIDQLNSLREGPANDRFLTDSIGNLLYRTTAFVLYRVDLDTLRLQPYPYFQRGHAFAIENHFDTAYGQVIQYNGQEVGRLWCTDEQATDGLFAAAYGPVGSNLGYPKGIQVWSAVTRNWINLDIPWYCQLVGWTEE